MSRKMIETKDLESHPEYKVPFKDGRCIRIRYERKDEGGRSVYKVLTGGSFGFVDIADPAKCIDKGSDPKQCWNISCRVKNGHTALTPSCFVGWNIQDITNTALLMNFEYYNPDDI